MPTLPEPLFNEIVEICRPHFEDQAVRREILASTFGQEWVEQVEIDWSSSSPEFSAHLTTLITLDQLKALMLVLLAMDGRIGQVGKFHQRVDEAQVTLESAESLGKEKAPQESPTETAINTNGGAAFTGDVMAKQGGTIIGRDQNITHIYQSTERNRDEEHLNRYLNWIINRTRRLQLGPLDEAGSSADQQAISLDQIYIGLSLNGSYAVNSTTAATDQYAELYSAALAHLYDKDKAILLGDPGSGKSTFLRYVAGQLAHGALHPQPPLQLSWTNIIQPYSSDAERKHYDDVEEEEKVVEWDGNGLIPIMINLRDFANIKHEELGGLAIWAYIASLLEQEKQTNVVPILEKKIDEGKILLLLDGVDEVPVEQRADVWACIDDLSNTIYAKCRWIATCRVLSYVAEEAPAGVKPVTLADFDQEQIEGFVDRWYEALIEAGEFDRPKGESYKRMLQQAAQRKRLFPLAQNPMLLTIMALVQTYRGTLPDERAMLYQACVETMLLRWQRHKEVVEGQELPAVLDRLGISRAELEQLLWEIAWEAHAKTPEREDRADIPEGDIIRIARKYVGSYANAEAFLHYTEERAHLLLGRGGADERVYAFPHRTFQEYLAACFLSSQRRFGREAARLAEQGDMWREVLNLAAGNLVHNLKNWQTPLDAVAYMVGEGVPENPQPSDWSRVWLAGEMAVVIGLAQIERDEEVGLPLLPKLRQVLIDLLEEGGLTPLRRVHAGDVLSLLGDPRPGVCIREPLMIPIPGGPFLYGNDKQEIKLEPFEIARYPVTNAQFRYFVEAGGYENPAHWLEEGWRSKTGNNWRQPQLWGQPEFKDFNHDNQPVVGVSWYEADAYVNWLLTVTGEHFALPTEEEWERAARHTDGREYPWGNEWQDGIINSLESGLPRTGAVGAFPKGQAVCGTDGMSGDVWEWTNSLYSKDRDWRVLRGGSWFSISHFARAAYRRWNLPSGRRSDYGFRLVRRPPSP